MLALLHPVEKVVEVVDPHPERPGRDLAVQHLRGDVGVVGRHLPPAGRAGFVRHADKADEEVCKGLDPGELHLPACVEVRLSPLWDDRILGHP